MRSGFVKYFVINVVDQERGLHDGEIHRVSRRKPTDLQASGGIQHEIIPGPLVRSRVKI